MCVCIIITLYKTANFCISYEIQQISLDIRLSNATGKMYPSPCQYYHKVLCSKKDKDENFSFIIIEI